MTFTDEQMQELDNFITREAFIMPQSEEDRDLDEQALCDTPEEYRGIAPGDVPMAVLDDWYLAEQERQDALELHQQFRYA